MTGAAIPQAEAPLPAAALSTISGRVDIAPELKDRLAPTDIVFIFARAATGPKMPLAILRKPASELPIDFKLDETMAMMPGMGWWWCERCADWLCETWAALPARAKGVRRGWFGGPVAD